MSDRLMVNLDNLGESPEHIILAKKFTALVKKELGPNWEVISRIAGLCPQRYEYEIIVINENGVNGSYGSYAKTGFIKRIKEMGTRRRLSIITV